MDELEYYVANGTEPADLKTLEMMKEEFAKSYASLEKELAARTGNIEQRNSQLDASQAELENYRQEYRRNNQEEKERLVEGELKEISAVKDQLTGQAVTLKRERDALDVKREEITDRVRQLNEIAEGKSIRYISGQDARLCEMNFLARFDTKMQSYPVRFYSPLEKKEFVIRCWNEGDHVNTSVSNSPDKPWNVQSRYSVNEKMFGLFGGKLSKIIVEGVSLNHLEEFEKYNFDSRRANLADFLKTITPIIDKAEIGKYLHVIGIASPTGWDEKVQKEIRSATFAHNYISRFVSICLVDSVTGEVIFNSADERISKFIEYFTPEFDREKVEKIRQYIIGRLAVKEYVVLDEAVAEIKEPKNIVNKVFYDLQHEGKGKIKYIKEVGLVIQTLK